jgi:Heparinase II/III-like protein
LTLEWYIKRIARMNALEILFRFGEQLKRAVSRRINYNWDMFSGGSVLPIPSMAQTIKSGMTPALEQSLREAVAALVDGQFSVHGVHWPKRVPSHEFPPDLWTYDPVKNTNWPDRDKFCFDISYRHRHDLGDIKYVWDFNRLQFLQPLAASVCLWNDKNAKAIIEGAIEGWYVANPPFKGLAWNSGIELSLRAISLIFVVSLCGDKLSADVNTKITTILRAHLFWLKRYPSRYSSANNHLVAELLGEFSIASVLDDKIIEADARKGLEKEAQLQIFADGVGAEQSPTYGAFTAEMILFADYMARQFGQGLSSQTGERLKAFATHIAWLCNAQGRVPDIGDDDGGRVISLCHKRELCYASSVARCILAHSKADKTLPISKDAIELRHALFSHAEQTAQLPTGLYSFALGGYTIIRENRANHKLNMIMDHGQLGYLSIAAHGHADALSFTLSLDNEDIFVDPGTYLYHSGGAWRDWFRGTRAHNTVTVEGVNQSIIAGPFNWSKKANSILLDVQNGSDWSILASHDGYYRQFGVHHKRCIHALADGIAIFDILEANTGAKREIESVLQLAPHLTVEDEGDQLIIHKNGKKLLKVTYSHKGEIKRIIGGTQTEGGWVSPLFGEKIEALRLVWHGVMPVDGLRTELIFL